MEHLIQNIIDDYLEHTDRTTTVDQLTPDEKKAIIWNLFRSDKYSVSYDQYKIIMNILYG